MSLQNAFENLAVESKQDAILTELEKKADLTETQPVQEQNPIDISGLATSAKQLPDGHEVEVNNFPASQTIDGTVTIANPTANPETGLAKESKQLADNHQVTVSNIVPASNSMITVPFTTTTVQAVGTTDVSVYRGVTVQIISQGGSSTVTFQGSNDNTNWVSVALTISTSLTTAPVVSTTAASSYYGPLHFKHFRLNVTGIASGTTAGVITFSTIYSHTNPITSTAVTLAAAATNVAKAEDSASASANVGIPPMVVRADTLPVDAGVSANGDYAFMLCDVNGRVYTTSKVTESSLPAGASTSANQTNGTQSSKFVDELGVPYGVKHIDNKPRVSAMPYLYDISEGNVPDHAQFIKNGYNNALSSSEETLWGGGGDYIFPATAQQMEVVSSSASDAAAGTGARTVEIFYLDNTYAAKTEVVTLNGTTPVATVATNMLRVNYFRVKTVGTGLTNAGDIDIRNLADTPIYSRIAAGASSSFDCIYTVPLGKTLYMYNILYSAGSNVANRPVRYITRANYDNVVNEKTTFFYPYTNIIITDGSCDVPVESPTRVPETVDIKINAISPDGASYGSVTVRGWIE